MKIPLSWLKDFVPIDLPLEELAHKLTMAGLEVEEIRYVGLPMPDSQQKGRSGGQMRHETKISGLAWDPDKIVVGAILEVMPHPNADRLVLCRLDDGQQVHTVLTGAPNLFPYKGQGTLEEPIKVAYAREGAVIYDGHQPGQALMTLKRAKIRGVESYSMACSEKELGISDEHEGIIILDPQAPTGQPLVDYMGDAVLDIAITPNIARDANVLGVAREVAAITGVELKPPSLEVDMQGPAIKGRAKIQILEPERNPRFVLGLVEGVQIGPSPYEVQRRLRLAGMRPINNIVDATNYAMLELGEPLHAFDYDVLVERAGGSSPTIITRSAEPGETLVTLDDVERRLDDFTVLVCDTQGPLSIAGVMGGLESEVGPKTRNVLLEGAAWNFTNIRRTLAAQRMNSEAAYRFSRGVHPAMAERGVLRGLEVMRRWAGGEVAEGLVDNYPLPPKDPRVDITPQEVKRWLGIDLTPQEIAEILSRLAFEVQVEGQTVSAKTPDHRLDIGEGAIGRADLLEEIARIYGYELIPETRMADVLPPQIGNPGLELEERLRDMLVELGLQEVITYRLTSPEREAQRFQPGAAHQEAPYVKLANPIVSDRNVLRHSLVSSVLEIVERNARFVERMALFEIGPIFIASEEDELPDELQRLVIALTGPRELTAWQGADTEPMDFFDLKGVVSALMEGLHIQGVRYEAHQHPTYHPGKCAWVLIGERKVGVFGELHPIVAESFEFTPSPVLVGDFDLQAILSAIPPRYSVEPSPAFPPVLEDLAVVVDEDILAGQVEAIILEAGGERVTAVRLFDVYRGQQIGPGKKSLAYSLTYQDPERTLTDKQVAKIRQRIVARLEQELGAKLRE
jgi:phenylalanyl-tRNA synthetase beta chain